MKKPRHKFFNGHLRAAYRSGLEVSVAAALTLANIPFQFETTKVPFTQPAKARTYLPDFILENGIVVESKGLFAAEDRQKHLWIKQQYPDLDLRFVFSNPLAKLYKGSPTTYASWCQKNGYLFAKKDIPKEWTKEPENSRSLAVLQSIGYSAQR